MRKTAIRGVQQMMTAALLLALVACQAGRTDPSRTVGTQGVVRSAPKLSETELQTAAARAYQWVLDTSQHEGSLDTDAALTERVRAVAGRLIASTPAIRSDALDWQWEVNVLHSEALMAWCLPGGKVLVHSGLITRLQLNDSEIAAALSHAMAHALRGHVREHLAFEQATRARMSDQTAPGQSELAQRLLALTRDAAYSRGHESEADRIGTELMARAGYDPNASIALWQALARARAPVQWLSLHRFESSREEDLRLYARRVMPFYEQAGNR